MVELVVVREHLGVVDLGLVLVEHCQLTVDQRAVAPSHGDEQVADATSHHFDLFLGDVDEGALHRVERIREFRELVVAPSIHRCDVRQHGLAARVAQRLDQCGQLFLGDLVGAP